jgi:hypothetical protein
MPTSRADLQLHVDQDTPDLMPTTYLLNGSSASALTIVTPQLVVAANRDNAPARNAFIY